jgi:hypothetical protein
VKRRKSGDVPRANTGNPVFSVERLVAVGLGASRALAAGRRTGTLSNF